MSFKVPERYRIRKGAMGSDASFGCNGAFLLPAGLRVIASDGMGWEHVSVSRPDRCPAWDEMCFVKALFWGHEDCVVQFHPPMSQYVDWHPYTLHLWRKVGSEFETPPTALIGPVFAPPGSASKTT